MRKGNNPNRKSRLPAAPNVYALVVTHLPDIKAPYHRKRLDVVRRSLDTLIKHAGDVDYRLIVWDNGSCDDLRALLREYEIDHLILSRNVGKINALKHVMRMLPDDAVLAYGDDDIEYFPGWLAAQIAILETFPRVGAVTGWPVRISCKWGISSTLAWAKQNARTETKRAIPDEWERDYCLSIERNYSEYQEATADLTETRITYGGLDAYAMSQHCQFVCYPSRVEPLLTWPNEAMSNEILTIDKPLDAAGFLRLSTVDRYTRHIGNILDGS